MKLINIKPLSVNKAWQGKRFKTKEYKKYETDCLYLLPRINIPEGKLKVSLMFGFSNKGADADNPVKLIVDILQKKYKFNDSRIYKYSIEKIDVEKGYEFIGFNIDSYIDEGIDIPPIKKKLKMMDLFN